MLFFHTGTHKTGSTALQTYLTANGHTLSKLDVSYEFPASEDRLLPIGNGQHLFNRLAKRSMPESELANLLSAYIGGCRLAVCSSEDLTTFGLDEWRQIAAACRQLGIQPRFITFVRDVAPYYLSLYREFVKSGLLQTSFEDFCLTDQFVYPVTSLKHLLAVFGKQSMHVIHYNSVAQNLDKALLATLGIDVDKHEFAPIDRTINRSLTDYELNVLHKLNHVNGNQYSLELSTLLLNRNPNLSASRQINAPILETLRLRHQEDINWINRTFFEDRDQLKLIDNSQNESTEEGLAVNEKQAIDQSVAEWCLSKMRLVKEDTLQFTISRLSAIDWENAKHPIVPTNFDPYAYLLLNQDVFYAGISPFRHFIEYGHLEAGRRRNWPET